MNEEKLVTISTRMDKESLLYLDKISKEFKLDRSTALRRILTKGIEEDKKESAIELYLKRELSIEGAAKFADIYIGEFLELLKSKGIELNLSLEDYKEGLKNLKSIWK